VYINTALSDHKLCAVFSFDLELTLTVINVILTAINIIFTESNGRLTPWVCKGDCHLLIVR